MVPAFAKVLFVLVPILPFGGLLSLLFHHPACLRLPSCCWVLACSFVASFSFLGACHDPSCSISLFVCGCLLHVVACLFLYLMGPAYVTGSPTSSCAGGGGATVLQDPPPVLVLVVVVQLMMVGLEFLCCN